MRAEVPPQGLLVYKSVDLSKEFWAKKQYLPENQHKNKQT
jgi:hypothetical protein